MLKGEVNNIEADVGSKGGGDLGAKSKAIEGLVELITGDLTQLWLQWSKMQRRRRRLRLESGGRMTVRTR